jgi:hypothetical protein
VACVFNAMTYQITSLDLAINFQINRMRSTNLNKLLAPIASRVNLQWKIKTFFYKWAADKNAAFRWLRGIYPRENTEKLAKLYDYFLSENDIQLTGIRYE